MAGGISTADAAAQRASNMFGFFALFCNGGEGSLCKLALFSLLRLFNFELGSVSTGMFGVGSKSPACLGFPVGFPLGALRDWSLLVMFPILRLVGLSPVTPSSPSQPRNLPLQDIC